MKDETILSLAAIIALVIILVACLFYGIDHVLVASISALIAGIAGYKIKGVRQVE